MNNLNVSSLETDVCVELLPATGCSTEAAKLFPGDGYSHGDLSDVLLSNGDRLRDSIRSAKQCSVHLEELRWKEPENPVAKMYSGNET